MHLLAWVASARHHGLPGSFSDSGAAGAHSAPRAILLASTRALRPLVLCGKFYSSLEQQLTRVYMALPPLRNRLGDLPILTEQFLERWSATAHREGGRVLHGLAPDLLPLLMGQRWGGNIRKLHAVLAQAAARCQGEWLRAQDAAPACGVPAPVAAPVGLALPRGKHTLAGNAPARQSMPACAAKGSGECTQCHLPCMRRLRS